MSSDPLRQLTVLMAELRAQCRWTAAQDHTSLAPYAIEEAYELAEAAETGDRGALREELGDLLLQVVFHAAIAAEHATEAFDLHDIAATLAAKLRRRHPHVFGSEAGDRSLEEIEQAWQRIKEAESAATADSTDPFADIPVAASAVSRAQKVARRMHRRHDDPQALLDGPPGIGRDLMTVVLRAEAQGVDAEAELRTYLRKLRSGR